MKQVILIEIQTEAELSDIQPDGNFLVLVTESGNMYRGNGTSEPILINDSNGSNFANHFLLLG